ncbi:hypothetical protein AB0A63_01670 [Lentzea sp. NPDC042327]|uniref:hypothetical protein n=1 Tax=Lentzea sp. NPDC042327 TaxID=3154801 RepID=UPI0033C7F9BA
MKVRWRRRGLPRVSLPGRSPVRWLVTACGLGVLVVALIGGAEPYRQTREFRAVAACEQGGGGCFETERGSIADRRTYTTTSTQTDANGHSTTTTTTHFEVTWQRADGSRRARDVPSDFYSKAREGDAAELRLWRGEVVGVQVTGAEAWFLPTSGSTLRWWLHLGFLGLGVLLWGLFLGWWDGLFMLAFRTFAWMFLSFVPVSATTHALAYGWPGGWGLVGELAMAGVFTAIAGGMLYTSLDGW